MSQDGTWWIPATERDVQCQNEVDACNACGELEADLTRDLLPDGRCTRCHQNGNPPHSWCLHPMPR